MSLNFGIKGGRRGKNQQREHQLQEHLQVIKKMEGSLNMPFYYKQQRLVDLA